MTPFADAIRAAARKLIRSPGFALTASLTLALGIGLSTAVFTVADALWIRRLPVRDQDRVVALWGATRDGQFANYPLSYDEARDLAKRSTTLERTAFFGYEGAFPETIQEAGGAYRLRRALVTGNFFDVVGSRAVVGRALRPEDDVAGAAPVVVLSHRAWRGRFNGDASIVGRRITMVENGRTYTVVGVMPQGLDYPKGVEIWARELTTAAPTVYIPNRQSFFPVVATTLLVRTTGEPAELVATLRRVVSDVDARLAVATAAPFDALLDEPRARPTLNALLLSMFAMATLALATIGLFAVIATMVRQRTREIGIRIALGATGESVRRMVLGRGLRLAGIGAALGTLIGLMSSRYLRALLFDVSPNDLPTLVLVPCVMLVAAALASYVPARASTRIDPMLTLRSD